jgi:hypothetical protein
VATLDTASKLRFKAGAPSISFLHVDDLGNLGLCAAEAMANSGTQLILSVPTDEITVLMSLSSLLRHRFFVSHLGSQYPIC